MSTSFNRFVRTTLLLALPLLLVLSASATPVPSDTCLPIGCKTFTQGGYAGACPGPHPVTNPKCIRDDYFDSCIGAQLVLGGTFTLTFTSAAAVAAFPTGGGGPAAMTANHTDPVANIEAGEFAHQVLALALNLGFSNCGITGFCSSFGSLRIYSGPFENFTVQQLFVIANQVLGGNLGALPVGTTLTQLNTAVDAINNNFDNGTVNHGYLVEPDCLTEHQLAVELLGGLNAFGGDGVVSLAWSTASESQNDHFDLYRDGAFIDIVPGAGTTASRSDYRYTDHDLQNGHVYRYSLVAVDAAGVRRELATASATPVATSAAPREFALLQNYPNPFNPTTTITYLLKDAAQVKLTVYDLTGRTVATLVNNMQQAAGAHTVNFDASSLATGVYLYRLDAGAFSATRKLMLMK